MDKNINETTFTMRVFDDMPGENWWLEMENLRAPNKMTAEEWKIKQETHHEIIIIDGDPSDDQDEIIEEINNFEEDQVEDEEQNINQEEPTLKNSSENVPCTQPLMETINFMCEPKKMSAEEWKLKQEMLHHEIIIDDDEDYKYETPISSSESNSSEDQDEVIEENNFKEDQVEDEDLEPNNNQPEPTLKNSSENVPCTQPLMETINFMSELVISENRDKMCLKNDSFKEPTDPNKFTCKSQDDDLEEVENKKPEEPKIKKSLENNVSYITSNSHQTALILMENTNNISKNTSGNCDEVFPKNDYLEKSSDSGIIKCKHCKKSFKSRRNYKKHELTHTDKSRLLKCQFCDKQFERLDFFEKHILMHNDKGVLKCEHCSKKFQRKDHFKKHLLIHNDKSPLKCKYCDRKFQRKDHFKNHELSHVDDCRFKCKHCDKKFLNNGHFKHHLLKHTRDRI